MAKEPFVYGWNEDGRNRCIVLTRSRTAIRRAMQDLGYPSSDARLRDYGSETGNEVEIEAATAAGEGVVLFVSTRKGGRRSVEDYQPLPPIGRARVDVERKDRP